MTLQGLLNADMQTLGQWIRQGWAWWIDELSGLLPASMRAGAANRPRLIAQPAGEGYRLYKDGRELSATRPPKPLRVTLALAPEAVLIREMTYPPLPLRDVRRMVELDIDRLTPFRAQAVYFDLENVRQHPDGRREVRLGVVNRLAATEALRRAEAWNLEPLALGIVEGGESHFDFLPAIRAAAGVGSPERRRLYWWGAVAALTAVNLLVFVGLDMADVAALQRTIDSQRPSADVALKLRHRVEGERDRRASLLARRIEGEPLRVIAAASGALARDAWVQRLEWNGRAVRLSGYKSGAYDVLAAMRGSPAFANVRSVASDVPAKLASGQPFDIVAEVRRASR